LAVFHADADDLAAEDINREAGKRCRHSAHAVFGAIRNLEVKRC
jgi:hypothetical protein